LLPDWLAIGFRDFFRALFRAEFAGNSAIEGTPPMSEHAGLRASQAASSAIDVPTETAAIMGENHRARDTPQSGRAGLSPFRGRCG
jgi:hypothetical protein